PPKQEGRINKRLRSRNFCGSATHSSVTPLQTKTRRTWRRAYARRIQLADSIITTEHVFCQDTPATFALCRAIARASASGSYLTTRGVGFLRLRPLLLPPPRRSAGIREFASAITSR